MFDAKPIPKNKKICTDWIDLKQEIETHYKNKTIVLTSGTFDLLHYGHLHVLQKAIQLGDVLIVAVNTDQSVKRYKGAMRPINSLEHRMAMLAALEMTTFVVSFSHDTPKEIIAYFRPDVFVKGGDYKDKTIAGADIVIAYGGAVHITDYIHGVSTTNMIKKIMGAHQEIKI